jgi:DNA-binding GntR family transcriptional regulator
MDVKNNKIGIPTTITETIYRYLREAIINGQIKQGERIKEKEIATLFNVSSTPVREAFFRLVSEKYIKLIARNKFIVNETSFSAAKDLYEIVRTLDKLALTKALANMTDDAIEAIKKMTIQLEKYYKMNERDKYLAENLKIHNFIWKFSGNEFLYELLVEIMNKIAIYRHAEKLDPFSDQSAFRKSIRDHLQMVKLIEARDISGLMKLIDSHWGEEFIRGASVVSMDNNRSAKGN